MRPMRRAEREVTEEAHIREILEGCETLRLGLWDGEEVYVVPVSYGYLYEEGRCTLYFHGSAQGRKAEILARGGNVGFELDRGAELVTAEVACGHSTRYQSIVGSGEAQRLVDPEEKRLALRQIMRHYTGRENWDFPDAALEKTAVWALRAHWFTAKERG